MNILVTGGAGFIASHVVDACIREGHRVIVVDNLFTGRKENVNKKAEFHNLDICSSRLEGLFKENNIDIVSHHAAQLDVRKSVENPIFDAQVNIIGSLNLLENAVKYKVKKFIFASSGGVMYGEAGDTPPDETFPANPRSPYGVSKLSVEHYLAYFGGLYDLEYTILRYANVYGPRQDPFGEAGVVAIFSNAMLKDEKVKIFGDGEQLRDYVFVGDVVRANILALGKGDKELINIGAGSTNSVNTLFKEMKKIINYDKEPVYRDKRPGELFRSSLDVSRAEKVLDWKSGVEFKKGLSDTIGYFRREINEG